MSVCSLHTRSSNPHKEQSNGGINLVTESKSLCIPALKTSCAIVGARQSNTDMMTTVIASADRPELMEKVVVIMMITMVAQACRLAIMEEETMVIANADRLILSNPATNPTGRRFTWH